jgi:hypothetical protein
MYGSTARSSWNTLPHSIGGFHDGDPVPAQGRLKAPGAIGGIISARAPFAASSRLDPVKSVRPPQHPGRAPSGHPARPTLTVVPRITAQLRYRNALAANILGA